MKKIIIIGASLSGIITSILLAKVGYNVEVYEETNILGGKYGINKHCKFDFQHFPFFIFNSIYFKKFLREIDEPYTDHLEELNNIDIYINPNKIIKKSNNLSEFTNNINIIQRGSDDDFLFLLDKLSFLINDSNNYKINDHIILLKEIFNLDLLPKSEELINEYIESDIISEVLMSFNNIYGLKNDDYIYHISNIYVLL